MDIVHKIGIKAPTPAVYQALSTIPGLAQWWTTDTTGEATVGGRIRFWFSNPGGDERGGFVMEVLELERDRLVRWRVVDGPAEWVGTDIDFTLSQSGEYATVLFGHRNWREWGEFMSHCSTKWASFLFSLREMLETGKGRPAPYDMRVDDWD
jgi:uncharacterized protein YndB with AHSA1/START domain